MEFGYMVGWIALGFGILVPLPQLYKMIKTKKSNDVSLMTYVILCITMSGYLYHANFINAPVFMVANSINLLTNSTILVILVIRKKKYGG